MFIRSEKTNGIGQKDIEATKKMELLSEEGFEKMMQENEMKQDALLVQTVTMQKCIGA